MKTVLASLVACAAFLSFQGQAPPAEAFLCPPCGSNCHFVTQPKPGACGGCGMKLVPLASVPQAGVLLYEGADLVSATLTLGILAESNAARAFTVADTTDSLRLRDTLELVPQFSLAEAPALDVLVVPQGFGAWDDELVVEWVKGAAERARFVVGVGAGSLVLAKAGFLKGERVALPEFVAERAGEIAPDVVPDASVRLSRAGKFFLARDPLAAAEAALAVVAELAGPESAKDTARELGLALPEGLK